MKNQIDTVAAARTLSGVAAAMFYVAMEFADAWSLAMHGDRESADPRQAGRFRPTDDRTGDRRRDAISSADDVTLVGRGLNDAVGPLNSSAA